MRQSVEISNAFNTLTLKQIFWKTKTFFKKLEYWFLKALRLKTYHFHTKLPYQKPMLRQIKWVSTKWIHHKERSFTSNYFIFLKILFQLKTSYKELILCIIDPNVHISTFCKHWSFIWRCFFPVSILKFESW